MKCNNCRGELIRGQTCFEDTGRDNIFCSAQCFAEYHGEMVTWEGE